MPDPVPSEPQKPSLKQKVQSDKEKDKKQSKQIKLSKAVANASLVAPDQADDEST